MKIEFEEFLRQGFIFQQKYEDANGRRGPLDDLSDVERYEKVIEFLGHLVEEAHEVRQLVPRRAWRTDEVGFLETSSLRQQFVEEMFDLLLFFRNVMSFAGIRPEEFSKVAEDKFAYNETRSDHRAKEKTLPSSLQEKMDLGLINEELKEYLFSEDLSEPEDDTVIIISVN